MARDVARAPLYPGLINLWVEDDLTREYLSALWGDDPDVFFLVGGGNEGVRAVVEDARTAGFSNVFGLTDRDFRPTNKPRWNDPGKTFRTFVLPVHEIENYLLDPAALHASRLNNRALTESQIDGHLNAAAARLCWWEACREVIAEVKHRFRDEFVPDPPRTLSSHAEASDHVCKSTWFSKLASECAKTSAPEIEQLLTASHSQALQQIQDATWRVDFAGKEVFHDIGSRICDRTTIRGYSPTALEFDIDLAKDVAASQVASASVPIDLVDLLSALKSRIARTPPAP